jgi:hypothetical protein
MLHTVPPCLCEILCHPVYVPYCATRNSSHTTIASNHGDDRDIVNAEDGGYYDNLGNAKKYAAENFAVMGPIQVAGEPNIEGGGHREDGTGRLGQGGRDRGDGTGGTGRVGRDREDGSGRTRQGVRERKDGTRMLGQRGRDRKDGTGRTGQEGRDREDGTGGTGQGGRGR